MSSIQNSYSSTLSLTDIMENGFLMGSSSSCISSGNSYSLEINNISKSDAGDNASNLMMGSLLTLKVSESSPISLKGDLQASCDSVAPFCKTSPQPSTFDLSNGNCANSRANCKGDGFCDTKSSTPCKVEKLSKLAENVLNNSEMSDPVVFKKLVPPLVWEISGIQVTRDNTLLLESSLEELGSLGFMKPDTPSLEVL